MTQTTETGRIIGTFYKQQWGGRKGDDAIACGEEEFDATTAVLLLPLDELVELEDNSESTDDLGRDHVSWEGPCYVRLTDSVCDFFGVTDVEEITLDLLEKARAEFEPQQAQTETVVLSIALKVKVQPGIDLNEVVQELRYSFTSTTVVAVIVDSEIRETDVSESICERPRG